MGKQASQGSTNERQQRGPNNQQRGEFSTLNRMLLGQLVNPPDTAISTPLQQSVSNLQGGFGTMRQNYGLAGGLADQLAGRNTGGGQMAAGPQQWGLQSRAQLGLPDRDSYFTFKPSAEDVASLGAVPQIASNVRSGKARRQFENLTADDTRTPKQEQKLQRLQQRHPEWRDV